MRTSTSLARPLLHLWLEGVASLCLNTSESKGFEVAIKIGDESRLQTNNPRKLRKLYISPEK
jgi:hypothetical protein